MKFHTSHPCTEYYGIQKRPKPCIPDVPLFAIPDIKNASPLMTDPEGATQSRTHVTERYAALIMILFVPYRNPGDLKYNGTFLETYRKTIVDNKDVLKPDIIQNFQNCHNALRVERAKDPLFDATVIYETEEDAKGYK